MLQKDQDVHKQENSRIMKENVTLLQEITDLRTEVHVMRQQLKHIGGTTDMTLGSTARSKMEMSLKEPQTELQKELQMQDLQIEELTSQI